MPFQLFKQTKRHNVAYTFISLVT